jgi:hypothetical protein
MYSLVLGIRLSKGSLLFKPILLNSSRARHSSRLSLNLNLLGLICLQFGGERSLKFLWAWWGGRGRPFLDLAFGVVGLGLRRPVVFQFPEIDFLDMVDCLLLVLDTEYSIEMVMNLDARRWER